MKKTIYEAVKAITAEKIQERRGKISRSQMVTRDYLKKLHEGGDPVQKFIDQYIRRYR